jgi:hypothetical protein
MIRNVGAVWQEKMQSHMIDARVKIRDLRSYFSVDERVTACNSSHLCRHDRLACRRLTQKMASLMRPFTR